MFKELYIVWSFCYRWNAHFWLFSSPGAAGRRPVEDLQTFWCCALHQGPAGLHALGQDTGQWFDLSAGSRGMDNRGRTPPRNSCPWLHMTFCFVPLFLSIKVRASRILFTKLTEHPQRSGQTYKPWRESQFTRVVVFLTAWWASDSLK